MLRSNRFINLQKQNDNSYIIETDGPKIKLFFMTDDIIRIRASFSGNFDEESYILTMTAWEDRLDAVLGKERKRIEAISPKIIETEDTIKFTTATSTLVTNKNKFGFELINNKDETVYKDLHGRAFKQDKYGKIFHYNEYDRDNDNFFGFGETTGQLNKARKRITLSPKDAIGYDAEKSDPLYKHIPFYIRHSNATNHAVGLFYHNTYDAALDMGSEASGYWPRYSYYTAENGDIDLFLINGPSFKDVIKRYTDLTGKTAFCPMHGLGYLGSTMYYVELPKNCDDEIVGFIDKNIKEGIPIDNFQLSSGYTVTDGNLRNVFTWNKTRFNKPEEFFKRMNDRGVTVSPNIKPGILTTNPNYKTFDKKKAFVKCPGKNKTYVDQWWGGSGSFVDFTNPTGRETWKNFVIDQLISKGTTSVWNDNNEYDSIDDKDAECSNDGRMETIDRLKPIQSTMMAYTAHKAINEVNPEIRPYVVNRSGFAGIQRYAQTWAGDNFTSWKTLKFNINTMLGMGLSGVANNGCDVGGFWGSCPEAELLVRWIQNGIFQPRFSIHSCNTNNTVTEPWMYSDYTDIIRDTIKFRYRMIPYWYSLLYEAHTKGTPMMRPLFYEFQNDPKCYEETFQFMIGSSLLVANVIEKGAITKEVYLPAGSNWYYWPTREKLAGGQTVEIDVDISTIPMFIRDNGIIVMSDNFTSINKGKINNYNILIAPDKDCSFTMFEDDGNTYKYLEGDYLQTEITVNSGDKTVINFNKEGNYKSTAKDIMVQIIRKDKGPFWATLNDKKMKQFIQRDKWEAAEEGWYYSATLGTALVKYKNINESYELVVSFEKFDLIGM